MNIASQPNRRHQPANASPDFDHGYPAPDKCCSTRSNCTTMVEPLANVALCGDGDGRDVRPSRPPMRCCCSRVPGRAAWPPAPGLATVLLSSRSAHAVVCCAPRSGQEGRLELSPSPTFFPPPCASCARPAWSQGASRAPKGLQPSAQETRPPLPPCLLDRSSTPTSPALV